MSPQQKAATEAASFVQKFNDIILFPTIALLSAVAFLVFLWGCAQYFMNATNDKGREEGVKHITYGIIGLVVMLSAYAIMQIAASTFGLDKQLNCANNPTQGGCDDAFTLPDVGGGAPSTDSGAGGGAPGTGGGAGSI